MNGTITVLRQFFGVSPRAVAKPEPIRTPVLLASARGDDAESIEEILGHSRWTPATASDWTAALKAQETMTFPVVLCDRDLPGLTWKEGVRAMKRIRRRPAIILLSDVDDPYLWDAVVQAGGFDLLARPLRARETLNMITFAHTHWRSGWPSGWPERVTIAR